MSQGRHQPRYADGKSGGRYRLAAKARHEPVVTPAACHRAEAHRAAVLVGDLEGELHLVNRAGIVFEAAHDRRIDPHPVLAIAAGPQDVADRRELVMPGPGEVGCDGRAACFALAERCPEESHDRLGLARVKPGTAGEITALVLAPRDFTRGAGL